MLSKENNERICRTDRGTPMGEAMRRYWMPALLIEELPEPDSNPVRVRLLGEDLIAFRTTDGKVGLIGDHCPHRGASLFFGRNEEGGLRCVYHGWKFDTAGACVDMPNEPPESNFKDKIHHVAYPTVEMAGTVWAYMGPQDNVPPVPTLEFMRLPGRRVFMSKTWEHCNYLQAIEGGIDTSHSSFLHRTWDPKGLKGMQAGGYRARSTAPKLEVVKTDYGYRYAGIRHLKEERQNYVRVYQFVMPFYQMRSYEGFLPGRPTVQGHMWVPIDDEHCWVYNWMYTRGGEELTDEEIHMEEEAFGRGPADLLPGYRPKQNAANDYLIDRQAQKTLSFTGIPGVNTQDMAMQESMGPIYDRTQEHLGTADLAVITTRQLLLQACKDVEEGRDPLGSRAETLDVRPAEMVTPEDVHWYDAMKEELVAKF
jgi:phenylpropionate dioxygenase-like ring-hydroxylating dioxygenase large terminal subunit